MAYRKSAVVSPGHTVNTSLCSMDKTKKRSYLLSYEAIIDELTIRNKDIFQLAKRIEFSRTTSDESLHREETHIWALYDDSFDFSADDLSLNGVTPIIRPVVVNIKEIQKILLVLSMGNSYLTKEAKFLMSSKFGRTREKQSNTLQQLELYPWQSSLQDELRGPADRRKVIWYFDRMGNTGKTMFAYWLDSKYAIDCLVLDRIGKRKHFSREVYEALNSGEWTGKILIIDLSTRSEVVNMDYACLEYVRNGRISSPVGKAEWIPDFVIVFSRLPPVVALMSMDRWDIRELISDPLVGYPMESRINAWYFTH